MEGNKLKLDRIVGSTGLIAASSHRILLQVLESSMYGWYST